MTTIAWLRQDLRVRDQPLLADALARGERVVPVFIWSPEEEGAWAPGAASRWWLHHSLSSLDERLRALGSRLILRCGPALAALRALVRETGASRVTWSRRYEPAAVARDARVEAALSEDGVELESFNASLLFEPWTLKTSSGGPYRVFTPFWRACLGLSVDEPAPAPRGLAAPGRWPKSVPLESLELLPRIDWAGGLRAAWRPGEAGALALLERFVGEEVGDYVARRDLPGEKGTSGLSPHLRFGEISPRVAWHESLDAPGAEAWRRQLAWREFAHHLLFHFEATTDAPLRQEYVYFPWQRDETMLRAWQRGATGYPIVDAGLRELWRTGWMHGRVRMIVASFLVKDLLIPWQDGARWFWDTLVDADLANNTLGWQWVAGCGADASPFFRIFNPVLQGRRFDPEGAYVRRFVPELARLPARAIHEPWTAREGVLRSAGVTLGRDYPHPIVDHAAARERALAGLAQARRAGKAMRAGSLRAAKGMRRA